MNLDEGYAPGWDADVVAMMSRRTADERASFALPLLGAARRSVDVGCGPGAITVGLARTAPAVAVLGLDREASQVALAREAARRAEVTNARFARGSAYALPVEDGSVDLVFAHAVFEHLALPLRALAEAARILCTDGALALSSSDWSGARLEPFDEDVEQALRGHHLLRRRAGGDPFGGGALPGLVAEAGFVDVGVRRVDRVDMAYDELARYVASRLREARASADGGDRDLLRRAAAAAERWARRTGTFTQRWVEVTARRPPVA